MSCGCKTNNDEKKIVDKKISGLEQVNNKIYESNILFRLLYFCIAAPLVVLLLPMVFIVLFNHIILGNSTNVIELFKKIFLVNLISKFRKKREEKRNLEEDMENSGDYEYDDVYLTPVDKIDSEESK